MIPTPDKGSLADVATSFIRVGVATVVGAVVSWAVRHGVNLDKAAITAWLTPVCMFAYFAVVRVLETKVSPVFGWLLGVAKAPAYAPGPPPQPEPVVVPAPVADGEAGDAGDGKEASPAGSVTGTTVVPGPPRLDPRLDRIRQFDVRNADYPIRAILGPEGLRSYTWTLADTLDQGQEGACVGFSITQEIKAKPVVDVGDAELALRIYHLAQTLDEYPGEGYSGTSVLAGMKAATQLGYYSEYRWAFSTEDLVRAVGRHGPAVIGIDWYESMFEPDDRGFLPVTGNVAGGHAILVQGVRLFFTGTKGAPKSWANVDLDRSYVTLHNSWGPMWGDGGTAKLRLIDLDRLLKAGGDAAVPVRRLSA